MAEAERSPWLRDDGLDELRGEIARCRLCRDAPLKGVTDRLPYEPRPVVVISTKARILIAGQAPGLRVHDTGIPFNDASGDRLRQWLDVDRQTFYDPERFAIVPMGFCFPGYDDKGSDLPPRRECAPLWRERVMAAMPQVELILAVGQCAQAFHLGERRHKTMTETVENWRSYLPANSGPGILPLPHPSWRNTGWLKKNAWFTEELLPVLRQHVEMRI
ncbi:uracil-DNA glycosylase family protein [Agrobacterium sp. El2ro-1b]|uniref:uracil-DNA glycosylase family protein n=1 Tax=Agrobacterium sp. El2ro-1b TaxID=2969528 RepID=UPI003AAB3BC9